MAATTTANLINPEVLADAVAGQLAQAIRFAPYARVDSTLEGQPGDTITRPKYAYIGAAADLVEGVAMATSNLSMTTTTVTIKEAGKAVEVTEKAIAVNVNGTMAEAANQITLALADKMEIDYLASLGTTLLKFNGTAASAANIIDAVDVFDDEDAGDYVLFMNNKDYTILVKSLFAVPGETATQALTKAQVSELVGVKDIVKTKRLPQGTSYLQKQGAVEIVYKARPQINSDHDILARTFVLAGNQYYTTNLYNEGGVVEIKVTI